MDSSDSSALEDFDDVSIRRGRSRLKHIIPPVELKILYGIICLILSISSFLPAFIFLGVGSVLAPVKVNGLNIFLIIGGIFLLIGLCFASATVVLCCKARAEKNDLAQSHIHNCKHSICRCRSTYEPIASV